MSVNSVQPAAPLGARLRLVRVRPMASSAGAMLGPSLTTTLKVLLPRVGRLLKTIAGVLPLLPAQPLP